MPLLSARVEPELKKKFAKAAKLRNLSESEFLRLAVLLVLDKPKVEPELSVHADAEMAEIDRMTIRLARFQLIELKHRAKKKGMAPSRFVSALVLSNLSNKPVMNDEEIRILMASNRELAAIGRNLNQIAHALNSAFHETERVKISKLAELNGLINEHRNVIRELIRVSQNSWKAV